MMTLLREKTGFILWFVIFAFVGLIVVEWGADYSGPGQEDVGNVVGVVNGETITLKDFQGALRQLARQTPQDQRPDQGQLVSQIWEGYIRDILLSQEIERLGPDDELQAWIQQQFDAPLDASALARNADSPQAAREIYVVSAVMIDEQNPMERAWLDQLASELGLSPEMAAELERQAQQAEAG